MRSLMLLVPTRALAAQGRLMATALIFTSALCVRAADSPSSLPSPGRQRLPDWVREEGLVMAGNWEALGYRFRSGRLMKPGEEQVSDRTLAQVKAEYSEEMAHRLKDAGINFVMIPLAKGLGPEHELPQREISARFAAICHELGLHVGVYIGGTMFYETMFDEYPDAENWCVQSAGGEYAYYNWSDTRMYYRRWINRDHPGARAYFHELVRIAIQEIHADLIHLDNYAEGPGYEPHSVRRFRKYLAEKYTPEQRERRFGFSTIDHIQPPVPPGPGAPAGATRWVQDPLLRDFIDYRATIQAAAYRDLGEYARSLDPDVMLECNPGGYYRNFDPARLPANDHLRLLQWGNAFWDEGRPSRLTPEGRMITRFRSEMLGRQFGNLVFDYTSEPVGMAESLALGLQCAGCPIFFDGGRLSPHTSTGRTKVPPAVFEYIRFFHEHQDLYRDADPVADVGVMNSFGDNCFSPLDARHRGATLEQTLYQGKVPFTLVPVEYPGRLERFRAIVLAGMYYVPAGLVKALHNYVQHGGALVLTGRTGDFGDLFPRLPQSQVVRAEAGRGRVIFIPEVELPDMDGTPARNHDEILEAVRWAAGGELSVRVKAPLTTTMAMYRQSSGRRLVHLVNYDTSKPADDVLVSVEAPVHMAKVYSPDDGAPPAVIPVNEVNGRSTVRLPRLKTYAVIELTE